MCTCQNDSVRKKCCSVSVLNHCKRQVVQRTIHAIGSMLLPRLPHTGIDYAQSFMHAQGKGKAPFPFWLRDLAQSWHPNVPGLCKSSTTAGTGLPKRSKEWTTTPLQDSRTEPVCMEESEYYTLSKGGAMTAILEALC